VISAGSARDRCDWPHPGIPASLVLTEHVVKVVDHRYDLIYALRDETFQDAPRATGPFRVTEDAVTMLRDSRVDLPRWPPAGADPGYGAALAARLTDVTAPAGSDTAMVREFLHDAAGYLDRQLAARPGVRAAACEYARAGQAQPGQPPAPRADRRRAHTRGRRARRRRLLGDALEGLVPCGRCWCDGRRNSAVTFRPSHLHH